MFEKGGRNVTRLSGSFSLELTCFHQDGFSQITREATEEKEFGRINHALYLQGIQLHGLWLVCCLSSAILHLYGVYGLVSCSLKVFEKMDREATKPLKDWTAFLQTPCSSYERWPSASVTEKHIFTIFTEKFDINDWFPQDILSEIFAKALSEDIPPGVNAYQHDGAGAFHLTWKIAEWIPSGITTRDGITAENSVDPQLNEGQDCDYVAGTDEDAQMKVTESEEFGAMVENLRTLDFEHEDDENTETRNAQLPPLGSPLADYDASGLQTEILSKLHHPNVVPFYGVVKDGPGGTLVTVTEFMVDGSLRHVLIWKDSLVGDSDWRETGREEPYANMHYGAIIGAYLPITIRLCSSSGLGCCVSNFPMGNYLYILPDRFFLVWDTTMSKLLYGQVQAPNPTTRPSFTEIAGRLHVMTTAATSNQSKPPYHNKASK
ncbi:BnaA06g11100D [Brassica napus]|uniref:BnaA06g11100D protein n=1 Tax=Brassica napus TaxID=3708 RepID=A0A078H9J6_BRANA|nr:BnaA06g11100D [Brassica napus]